MNPDDVGTVHVRRASAADYLMALDRVFAHLPAPDRERAVARSVAASREAPPQGLWVAYCGDRLITAALVQILPGRSAEVLAPRISAEQPREIVRELLFRAIDDLPRHDVRLAQALLEVDHGADAELLAEIGFRHVSDLLYLVSLRGSFPTALPQDALEFLAYSTAGHARLAKVLERTYVGSLDFPSVGSVRNVDDVLAGYRAAGLFDPARWMIVRHAGADVACLLLTDDPPNQQWELTAMGLVPEARGRGLGVAVVRHAQWLTRQAGRDRLVLAVDAANAPAIATYAAAGFILWDRRSVILRVW